MLVKSRAGSKSHVLPADPFFTKYNLNESCKSYFDNDLFSKFTGYLNPALNNPALKIK